MRGHLLVHQVAFQLAYPVDKVAGFYASYELVG